MPLHAPILAIESSGDSGGAAIFADGTLLAEHLLDQPRDHGAQLLPCIAATLRDAGLQRDQLSLVAVNRGPGSYTGLRIGQAAAEAIALALTIPTLGVDGLEIMAAEACRLISAGTLSKSMPKITGAATTHRAKTNGLNRSNRSKLSAVNLAAPDDWSRRPLIPALDARGGLCATAVFEWESSGVRRVCEDALLAPEELGKIAPDGGLLLGDAADMYAGRFPANFARLCGALPLRPSTVAFVAARGLTAVPGSGVRIELKYFRPIAAQTIADREREAKARAFSRKKC